MNSKIYEMNEFQQDDVSISEAVIILAIDNEERSKHALKRFRLSKQRAKAVILFSYNGNYIEQIEEIKPIVNEEDIVLIKGIPTSQYEFIDKINRYKSILLSPYIIVDISCIFTPYLFLLIKYINIWNKEATIYAINTIPYDYYYLHSPFTSFKSYYGDLKMEEIFGFSSSNGSIEEKDLFIFSGFEGAMSLKVEEETIYKQLYIVNALPSYQQKYKDISIINNYQLIISRSCNRLYTSANNPYETYNILNKLIRPESGASIAPLCTKPIALGICMYAMKHDNVRIVYPFSNRYELGKSRDVYKSFIYRVA